MTNIIQEIVQIITDKYETEMEKMTSQEYDISTFILSMREGLDQAGVMITGKALEELDEIINQSPERKRHWVVQSRDNPKTLATTFGEVEYQRTYYRNKKTGEYSHLTDELVGLKPHDRMDTSLKAELISEALHESYGRSGETAAENILLSSQTVMNTIRELGAVDNSEAGVGCTGEETKRTPEVLYIEADEDHVALQTGKSVQPRLVYVHEGRKKIGKDRWKLINPRYFSGVYTESEDLWVEVSNYLEEVYDTQKLERIYLSGDGASWIQKGAQWIRGSTLVLDRYHLSKYVAVATGHMNYTRKFMWEYINEGDLKNLKTLFEAILHETQEETKRQAVQEARRYILGNWEAIMNQYNRDYTGCSAEGHVSHILSSRLSSRPLGWSVQGVDQMARLRVFEANGGDIYELLMRHKKQKEEAENRNRADRKVIDKRSQVGRPETIGNVTILNIGKTTNTYKFLRELKSV